MRSGQNRGFTLIELLVVIVIIGILATVIVVAINPIDKFRRARDGDRLTSISTLKKAIDSYTTLHSGIPFSCDSLGACPTDFVLDGDDSVSQLIKEGNFLRTIPSTPTGSPIGVCDFRIYLHPSSERTYNLRFCIESWTQERVNNLEGNNNNYSCTWDATNQIALCYTGTDFNIPPL